MDEERDFVVFTDDDGNEFELDVIAYFDHKGNEYAILADCSCGCDCESCEDECEEEGLYIMRIVTSDDGQTEEFVPPADEDMDELVAVAEELLAQDSCDCGCEDGECDCGEHHCDCGCEDK
ncbi:MAG: DUF1292 domain-containing protein [Clostridia bacterium]|nr:DUF1292 domain-containing protein [Clostridia bacterium]MBR6108567.1 DUF1292 domain-containing protein [Clostridia bacterium]